MMRKEEIQKQIEQAVRDVKAQNPMAGSITNSVTVNFVANAQLAVGGSAAMVYLPDEGEFLAASGNAVYLNTGTLLPIHAESIPATAQAVQKAGKTCVLDPVGIGIGAVRTGILTKLKDCKPGVIRGNASEIIALASLWGLSGTSGTNNTRGVDSTDEVSAAKDAAVALARWTGGAVAVSGEVDLVTDGKVVAHSYGGSHFMGKVTGCGCSLGGVVAVYATVASPFIAALAATAVYNLAGQRAERRVTAPGSFQVRFLDELYLATPEEIAQNPFTLETL